MTVNETSLDTSVCALAIRQSGVFQIDDLSIDPRTAGMSLVTGEPGIRFYAGAPLVTEDGHASEACARSIRCRGLVACPFRSRKP